MTSVGRDLRVAARGLVKNPGFTAVVVLALALGLGVNTAVFSAVNTFVLRPLPVERPERLASVVMGPEGQLGFFGRASSYPDYLSVRAEDQIFSGVMATTIDQFALTNSDGRQSVGGEPAQLTSAELVSDNYFDVLGVRAFLGRTFTASEARIAGADSVVVLAHDLWKRRYNGDPNILGRKVFLNNHALTVIGVMPPGFKGMDTLVGVSHWFPLGLRGRMAVGSEEWITDRGRRDVIVSGRLRPGVTLAQAQERLNVLAKDLSRQYPATNASVTAHVTSEIEGRFGADYPSIKLGCALALFVAGLVLLISCANVANLLLARTTKRAKELGIRLALGASRTRIIRQLLTESMLMALLGGTLGLLLSLWADDLLNAFIPPLPGDVFRLQLEPDVRTMLWTFGATLTAGVAFGVFPAWRASRADVMTALKTDVGAEGQRMRRAGIRQALVVAQIAISIVVVVSGGLILRSVKKLEAVDPGYRTENLVSALVSFGMFDTTDAEVEQFYVELLRRLERLPGARSVSSTRFMPLVNSQKAIGPVTKEGEAPPPPNQGLMVQHTIAYAKYFETIGTEIIAGRDFSDQERTGIPSVALVNRELAVRLFGGEQEALGKRFRIGGPNAQLLQVIGVARNGRYVTLSEPTSPYLYLPADLPELNQTYWTSRTVMIRGASRRELAALAQGLRAEVQSLDARVPVDMMTIGDNHLSFSLYFARFAAMMGMVLSLLALGLATMGIYSVMTYTVSQRTKEIGIRMALGGQVRDVLRLVMGQGLRLTMIGVLVGALVSFAGTRLLNSLLFGISAADPLTFVATIVLLTAVALLATLIPARRAAKVDPMVALRYE